MINSLFYEFVFYGLCLLVWDSIGLHSSNEVVSSHQNVPVAFFSLSLSTVTVSMGWPALMVWRDALLLVPDDFPVTVRTCITPVFHIIPGLPLALNTYKEGVFLLLVIKIY